MRLMERSFAPREFSGWYKVGVACNENHTIHHAFKREGSNVQTDLYIYSLLLNIVVHIVFS